ncbi:hypothetical protein FRB91_008638 [Serendipita sp. 411]|nr:hypothetical protein FRC15_006555 [Serendipita sp. 397]KAG8836482.1 hypothetical protein FRB91_008638 [Serendipita sp. 411]
MSVEETIRQKLEAAFSPDQLRIVNDSWKHSSHAAMREIGGGNGETHFFVGIVSRAFEGKIPYSPSLLRRHSPQGTLARHRLIYATLDEELKTGVHALQLETRTPAEVEARKGNSGETS